MGYFILNAAVSFLLAPLMMGVINKTKAFFAGRKGVSIFQLYFDIFKLMKKERVYSTSSNWILRIAPASTMGLTILALLFLPLGTFRSPLSFTGDVILFFYFLGTARFLTVLAALETGSSFEGMGASREVQFSALAEGTLFAVLGCLALRCGDPGLSGILQKNSLQLSSLATLAPLVLVAGAFYIILLCENSRLPFDDPETHLELTMIHEAMVLDYGGADLAAVFYAAALKFYLFASFLVMLLLPEDCYRTITGAVLAVAGVFVIAVITGIVESCMARSRFLKLPQLLAGATVLAALAIILQCFLQGGLD
ncbi:MAG: NADH-quinone oxidoreductase subunit H [Lentisphaeria bacterium]|nr:NADH-quinone oxidoreductase subunit H [Lentisphaeria bacterium]